MNLYKGELDIRREDLESPSQHRAARAHREQAHRAVVCTNSYQSLISCRFLPRLCSHQPHHSLGGLLIFIRLPHPNQTPTPYPARNRHQEVQRHSRPTCAIGSGSTTPAATASSAGCPTRAPSTLGTSTARAGSMRAASWSRPSATSTARNAGGCTSSSTSDTASPRSLSLFAGIHGGIPLDLFDNHWRPQRHGHGRDKTRWDLSTGFKPTGHHTPLRLQLVDLYH